MTDTVNQDRYCCKFCGSPVDPVTKKCTQCGMQHSRLPAPKKFLRQALIIALVAGLIVFSCLVYGRYPRNPATQAVATTEEPQKTVPMTTEPTQAQQLLPPPAETQQISQDSLQSQLEAAQQAAREAQEQYRALFSENYDLTQENQKLKKAYAYCSDFVVVVLENDSQTYHRCDCAALEINTGAYSVYTREDAVSRNLNPCFLCNSR